MTRTITGLFADLPAARRALSELGAAGFTRARLDDGAEHTEDGGLLLVVEVDGADGEIREILLRAGATRLEDREGSVSRPLPEYGATPPRSARPQEERHPHGGAWLREIVFGLNDGLVTTLVFIIATSLAAQTHAALLLIVLSEVTAGGVSMALGGYLSARTERDILAYRIATERREIETEPEEERAELRDIYRQKGLTGPLLDRVVAHQTADHDRWLRALVREELGVIAEEPIGPLRQGLQIGASFVLGGIIPSVPVLLGLPLPWMQGAAFGLTALTALVLGAVKARYSLQGPLRNGLEFLAVVTAGTLAGVIIGVALHAA